MNSNRFYVLLISLTLISIFLTALPTLPEFTRNVLAIPSAGGLLSLIFKFWFDLIQHERTKELQQRQQDFELAAASHMADVVFDKQVEFCESYSQALDEIIKALIKDGPSENVGNYLIKLQTIRTKYLPWLSSETEEKVIPFEKALREIAISNQLLNRPLDENSRFEFIDRMYGAFGNALGLEIKEGYKDPEASGIKILSKLRDLLNITDLEILRRGIVKSATSRLGNK